MIGYIIGGVVYVALVTAAVAWFFANQYEGRPDVLTVLLSWLVMLILFPAVVLLLLFGVLRWLFRRLR